MPRPHAGFPFRVERGRLILWCLGWPRGQTPGGMLCERFRPWLGGWVSRTGAGASSEADPPRRCDRAYDVGDPVYFVDDTGIEDWYIVTRINLLTTVGRVEGGRSSDPWVALDTALEALPRRAGGDYHWPAVSPMGAMKRVFLSRIGSPAEWKVEIRRRALAIFSREFFRIRGDVMANPPVRFLGHQCRKPQTLVSFVATTPGIAVGTTAPSRMAGAGPGDRYAPQFLARGN